MSDQATTDTERRLDEMERRLQRAEDVQAVQRTLVRYGFAVDSGDGEATADLYTEDCVLEFDFAGGRTFEGRAGARGLVDDETHQALLPNCAHLIGPMCIEVDGDTAVATGYASVVLREDDSFSLWREGCGRWELVRRGDRGLISRRSSMAVGSAEAQALLARGL